MGPTCSWKPWPSLGAVPSYLIANGKKWNCRLGYFTVSLLLMKPPASKWLLAPTPFFLNNQSNPILGALQGFKAENKLTGFLQAHWTYTSKWSCKFSPTPGKSFTTGIPKLFKCSAFPIPETCNNWGVLIAPPQQIISFP